MRRGLLIFVSWENLERWQPLAISQRLTLDQNVFLTNLGHSSVSRELQAVLFKI
jgi:hypothetical protein